MYYRYDTSPTGPTRIVLRSRSSPSQPQCLPSSVVSLSAFFPSLGARLRGGRVYVCLCLVAGRLYVFTAMSSGSWELVSRKKDRGNDKSNKLTKAEKRKFIENAPKVEDFREYLA